MVTCWLGLARIAIVLLLLKHGADPKGARGEALSGMKRESEKAPRFQEVLDLLPPEAPV